MFRLPMDDLSRLEMTSAPCTGPCFYERALTVDRPADTYLDLRRLHKGQAWIGDRNLGRFWSIGPVYTLYTPAPWLRRGANRVTVFDMDGQAGDGLATSDRPIYGAVTTHREAQ